MQQFQLVIEFVSSCVLGTGAGRNRQRHLHNDDLKP
jgi:hypothetical protein